jgi:hypothetical protein
MKSLVEQRTAIPLSQPVIFCSARPYKQPKLKDFYRHCVASCCKASPPMIAFKAGKLGGSVCNVLQGTWAAGGKAGKPCRGQKEITCSQPGAFPGFTCKSPQMAARHGFCPQPWQARGQRLGWADCRLSIIASDRVETAWPVRQTTRKPDLLYMYEKSTPYPTL